MDGLPGTEHATNGTTEEHGERPQFRQPARYCRALNCQTASKYESRVDGRSFWQCHVRWHGHRASASSCDSYGAWGGVSDTNVRGGPTGKLRRPRSDAGAVVRLRQRPTSPYTNRLQREPAQVNASTRGTVVFDHESGKDCPPQALLNPGLSPTSRARSGLGCTFALLYGPRKDLCANRPTDLVLVAPVLTGCH